MLGAWEKLAHKHAVHGMTSWLPPHLALSPNCDRENALCDSRGWRAGAQLVLQAGGACYPPWLSLHKYLGDSVQKVLHAPAICSTSKAPRWAG